MKIIKHRNYRHRLGYCGSSKLYLAIRLSLCLFGGKKHSKLDVKVGFRGVAALTPQAALSLQYPATLF